MTLRPSFFLVAVLAIWVITFSACMGKTVVSQSEVNDRIDKAIHPGSSAGEVQSFLESIEIKGLTAVHTPFISGKPAGTDNPISNPQDVAGYLIATIKNTGRDNIRLQVYRIEITFYFDKDERMIDYRAQTLGDW